MLLDSIQIASRSVILLSLTWAKAEPAKNLTNIKRIINLSKIINFEGYDYSVRITLTDNHAIRSLIRYLISVGFEFDKIRR